MKTFTTYILLLFGLYSYAQVPNDTIYTENITATKAYLGEYGSVTLEIDDAGDDGQITKPLIVAEGFDSGLQGVENEFGEDHLQEFIEDIQDSQSFDLGNLLTGNTEFSYGDQD
jgi:hypothetical protein